MIQFAPIPKPMVVTQVLKEAVSWPFEVASNLLFPPECAWCLSSIASKARICAVCRGILEKEYYACVRCAGPLPDVVPNDSCHRCRHEAWQFSRVAALGPYRGRMREAVILMKKPPFEALTLAAGQLLGERIERSFADDLPEVVVPVPNHWTRRVTHRTSSAEILASAISAHTGLPHKPRLIRRIRRTSKQGMLNWSSRKKNVRGAFAVGRPAWLKGAHILLVDDVFTSGATVAEIAKQLRSAGALRVSVAVVARGTGTSNE